MARTRSHLAFLAAWIAVMGGLYLAVDRFLVAPRATVTASGELRIPRARDGHFYVEGTVGGQPVEFLVDTGASRVVVSEALARRARLPDGTPTTFRTANGEIQGRLVPGVAVAAGPLSLSATTVGVGLVGAPAEHALLGQSFLSRFEVSITGDAMVLRRP